MRNDFRENGGLPNSSGNDLSILRTEIKNEHSLSPARGGKGDCGLQVDYFTDLAKIVKRDRSICSQPRIAPCGGTLSLASLGVPRLLSGLEKICALADPPLAFAQT